MIKNNTIIKMDSNTELVRGLKFNGDEKVGILAFSEDGSNPSNTINLRDFPVYIEIPNKKAIDNIIKVLKELKELI